ncbi:hypothetical protein [Sphingomonas corticis]|uniref:Uncharacterized protein n=1 Tax=Sphingomonas corticis TaxID=2722791 RepID=A0ABX1CU30_9SPHN|nr:hypothetical protein [Sphingomonas corticis]NJR80468.1 hypothetical protein [Sphingomonas corticis]
MSDKHRNRAIREATRAYCERLLLDILPPIREVAHDLGYAVAVHGSLANDIDLVAVAWVDHARDPDELARAVRGAVSGVVGRCNIMSKQGEKLYGEKPHGRRAYTLMMHPLSYIDLSVIGPVGASA